MLRIGKGFFSARLPRGRVRQNQNRILDNFTFLHPCLQVVSNLIHEGRFGHAVIAYGAGSWNWGHVILKEEKNKKGTDTLSDFVAA